MRGRSRRGGEDHVGDVLGVASHVLEPVDVHMDLDPPGFLTTESSFAPDATTGLHDAGR